MIHIIKDYYLTTTDSNLNLYKKGSKLIKATGLTEDKFVNLGHYNPNWSVGLPAIYRRLVRLKVEQEVAMPLIDLVEYIQSQSDEIKNAIINIAKEK